MEKDVEAAGPRTNTSDSNSTSSVEAGKVEFPRAPTAFSRFVDGFKRNPNARVTVQAIDASGRVLENQPSAEPALAMKLKSRHLQMVSPAAILTYEQ
jgi:yeast amino acid transporter